MSLSKFSRRAFVYALSVLLAVFSLFTVLGERGVLHLWRLWEEKAKLDERNFLLQTENEILRERIHRLRHDDLYLEKIAREELGLVRPGEIVYRFAPSESKRSRDRAISDSSLGPFQSSEQKPRR